jgi:hypothetical protein
MPPRRAPQPFAPSADRALIPWAIALAAAIGCIALAIWAVSLRGDLADAEDRVAALVAERDSLREAATATVYDLVPTAQGPAGASGSLYLTATGSGVLDAVSLPKLEADTVYQVWFLPPDDGPPIPGNTFTVNEDGVGFTLIAADTGAFKGVSISREPEGGSEAPTGPLLLTGAAAGARG